MSVSQNQIAQAAPIAAEGSPRSPGRLRWEIGILLGVGVLINDFDRVNLSVAVVGATSSFANVFIAAGAVLVIGIICYVFVLGRIRSRSRGHERAHRHGRHRHWHDGGGDRLRARAFRGPP
jgi:hypothetical protein